MPLVIFVDGFDHYAAADIARKGWTNNGSVSITAAAGRNGTAGLVIDETTNGGGVTLNLASALVTGYVEFAVKFAALPTTDKPFLSFLDAGTVHVDLRLTSAGALRITRNGTSLAVTGAGAIAAGTFCHIGVRATIDDAAGAYDVRVNAASVLSAASVDTRNAASASFNQIRLQNFWADPGSLTFDDFVLSSDGFCGDCRVKALLPQGAGNYSQWTPSAGLGWQCVDDASMNSDTDYVSSATTGQRNSYDFASAGATGIVKAVQHVTAHRKDDAGARTLKQFARISAADYDGPSVSAGDSYAMQRRVMVVNPATGADWTPAEIDGAEFGTAIVAPPVDTYLTRTGWTASASGIFGAGWEASRVLDGDNGTAWNSNNGGGTGSFLTIDMQSAQMFDFIDIVPRLDFRADPKLVRLEISTDGSSWTFSSNTWIPVSSLTTKRIPASAVHNCRYLRLTFVINYDASNVALAEVKPGLSGAGVQYDFAPHQMTSNTAPSPYVISASSAFSAAGDSAGAWNAFNASQGAGASGCWIGTGAGVDWLRIDLGSGNTRTLKSYALNMNGDAGSTRPPKTWTMQGSNDGSAWTTLDTVASETGWTANERRLFACDAASAPYRYFRLNITANNGDATFTQVGEMELFA